MLYFGRFKIVDFLVVHWTYLNMCLLSRTDEHGPEGFALRSSGCSPVDVPTVGVELLVDGVERSLLLLGVIRFEGLAVRSAPVGECC